MVAVSINKRITTLVTLQLPPSKGSNILNVLKAHKNTFFTMKLIDPIFKLTTFQKETINTSNQFQSSATEYTSKFKKMHKYPKSSRFCIYNKIKSVIPLTVIKYGNRHQLSNIFDTLVTNGTYLNLNTFSTHEEHSIGFFIHISLKITLRNNFRNTI